MATPSKTATRSLFALASNAASTITVGTALDVSTYFEGSVLIQFGRRSATAAGAGCNLRLEGSTATSTHGFWFPLATFTTNFAACTSRAVTTTSNSGQAVVTMTTTTGLVAQNIVFIDHTTIGSSEFHRIKSVSAGASITLEDNLINQQTTSSNVLNAAELFSANINLSSIKQIRLVVDGSVFTQAHAVQATITTLDSIT